MRRTKLNADKFHWASLPKLALVAMLLTLWVPTRSMAQQPGQKTFSSAEEATNALVTAAQANDEKMMLDILGPDGKQIVSSGDETEDANSRANFVKRYQEMHRLVKEPDGTTVLYIGAHNWPAPIPLMNKGKLVVFRHRSGQERNSVQAHWPQRTIGHPHLPGTRGGAKGILGGAQGVRPENLQ